MKTITQKLRHIFSLIGIFVTGMLLSSTPVYAASDGGALMESAPVKGAMRFLNDASVVMLIAAPILAGLLIGLFSMLMGANQEPHDKEKWSKCRKTVITALIWVFSATAVVGLITSYLK